VAEGQPTATLHNVNSITDLPATPTRLRLEPTLLPSLVPFWAKFPTVSEFTTALPLAP
jgi:hypothetical protein